MGGSAKAVRRLRLSEAMRAQSTSPSRSCRTELRQCRFTQPLTALFLAVRFEVEHRIVAALGHQAQPARDLLLGLDLAAQVAAEAILVELFIGDHVPQAARSEEHTSEHQSLMRISYAVFFLQKK